MTFAVFAKDDPLPALFELPLVAVRALIRSISPRQRVPDKPPAPQPPAPQQRATA
jgi:hypothetical protein